MQAPDVPGQFQRRMAALVVATANPRGRVHLAAENGSGGTLRGLPELARSGWTCPGTGTAISGPATPYNGKLRLVSASSDFPAS
jgi:hypothetical protein